MTNSESLVGEREPYEGDVMLHLDLPVEFSGVTLNYVKPASSRTLRNHNLKCYITAADGSAQIHTTHAAMNGKVTGLQNV